MATSTSKSMIPKRRREQELRELRLVVPNTRLASVRKRIAAQTGCLDRHQEDETLSWIEAVSEHDATDRSGQ